MSGQKALDVLYVDGRAIFGVDRGRWIRVRAGEYCRATSRLYSFPQENAAAPGAAVLVE